MRRQYLQPMWPNVLPEQLAQNDLLTGIATRPLALPQAKPAGCFSALPNQATNPGNLPNSPGTSAPPAGCTRCGGFARAYLNH